ncbi:MAG: polynucleotide adenylyltransferase PcnB [Treponema sp.]|nr:polynucleotide adenylyltransferase PcnB [Treponema sp.]
MRFRYSTAKDGKPVKKALVYTQDEHRISLADVDGDAVRVIGRLREAGFESYVVGGAVRDLILGKKPKDFDIVSRASPAQIKKLFRNSRVIGNRFRLVHVYAGKKIFEVCTFRSLKDGHTGNTFGTIEEDVLRRDFTLNALFYDPLKQIVVDFVGGMGDIRKKKICPIIPLNTIFKDDPVRMIRAVKYGAAAGFRLPLSLRWQIRRESPLLAQVSPSRLTEEINKIIRSSSAALIVQRLDAMGLYRYLQPNASKLLKENPNFRGTYLGDLEAAAGKVDTAGWAMSSLIRGYLEVNTDWEAPDPQENYRTAFIAARRFVLPMNPPRVELDHAVRLIFAEHGFSVKRARFPIRLPAGEETPGPPRPAADRSRQAADRPRRAPGPPSAGPEPDRPGQADPSAAPAKKRRRRRRRPGGPAPSQPSAPGE